MKLREAIVSALAVEGADIIFGVMGDGNMLLWSDMADQPAMRIINARTETGALMMAEGYRRAGGGIGVVTVTHGPGLAATAVGLGVIAAASAPILVIAGDVPRHQPHHVQAFPQEVFGSAMGATVFSMRTATDALSILQHVFRHIRLGLGPVLLTVATDVQDAEVSGTYRPTSTLPSMHATPKVDARALADVGVRLSSAKRPVLLAGRGARHAVEPIEALADRMGALLATTIPARGVFAGSQRDAGVMGGLCEPTIRETLADADLVVAFGASLNRFTLDFGSIVPDAQIVLINDRPPATPLHQSVDTVLLADSRNAAERLCEALTGGGGAWDLDSIQSDRGGPPTNLPAVRNGLFDPRAVVREANAHFPPDRTEVVGVGHFGGWPGLYSRLGRGGVFLAPWEFGAMGLSVPTAIGASLARPEKPVLAWEGDGSLLWSLGELDTLGRVGGRVTVVAMDDGAYGAEVWKLERLGVSAAGATFPRRPLAEIATALGVTGHAVESEADLGAALAAAAAGTTPALIHAAIDPAIRQEVF